jgi:hypothetical protein
MPLARVAAHHLVAGAGLGGAGREVDGDGADRAIAAERLEVGIGHGEVAVAAGMHAVAAGELVVGPELGLGLGHRLAHDLVDIGEEHALLAGDLARDGAELGQGLVVHHRLLGVVAEGLRIDAARRADHDDAHPRLLEGGDDALLGIVVLLAALGREGGVAAIVHAVAGGGDAGMEGQGVVGHAREEAP